jgi:hypothetical protein
MENDTKEPINPVNGRPTKVFTTTEIDASVDFFCWYITELNKLPEQQFRLGTNGNHPLARGVFKLLKDTDFVLFRSCVREVEAQIQYLFGIVQKENKKNGINNNENSHIINLNKFLDVIYTSIYPRMIL